MREALVPLIASVHSPKRRLCHCQGPACGWQWGNQSFGGGALLTCSRAAESISNVVSPLADQYKKSYPVLHSNAGQLIRTTLHSNREGLVDLLTSAATRITASALIISPVEAINERSCLIENSLLIGSLSVVHTVSRRHLGEHWTGYIYIGLTLVAHNGIASTQRCTIPSS